MKQLDEVNSWNTQHPIGTVVRYWPGIREGEWKYSKTRSEAFLVAGEIAAVMVDGCRGGILLSSVQAIKGDVGAQAPAPCCRCSDLLAVCEYVALHCGNAMSEDLASAMGKVLRDAIDKAKGTLGA